LGEKNKGNFRPFRSRRGGGGGAEGEGSFFGGLIFGTDFFFFFLVFFVLGKKGFLGVCWGGLKSFKKSCFVGVIGGGGNPTPGGPSSKGIGAASRIIFLGGGVGIFRRLGVGGLEGEGWAPGNAFFFKIGPQGKPGIFVGWAGDRRGFPRGGGGKHRGARGGKKTKKKGEQRRGRGGKRKKGKTTKKKKEREKKKRGQEKRGERGGEKKKNKHKGKKKKKGPEGGEGKVGRFFWHSYSGSRPGGTGGFSSFPRG